METTRDRGLRERVAPTHSTVMPPSDLCQARGKPAAEAHRSARASSTTCASGEPATTCMGSST
eukprot:8616849-Lingulodinium_polyedra.AAC.1